ELFVTVFGTGFAAVGRVGMTTIGCGVSVRDVVRMVGPKLALPSVTGMGGRLEPAALWATRVTGAGVSTGFTAGEAWRMTGAGAGSFSTLAAACSRVAPSLC